MELCAELYEAVETCEVKLVWRMSAQSSQP